MAAGSSCGGVPSRIQFAYRPTYFTVPLVSQGAQQTAVITEDASTPAVVANTGSTNPTTASFSPPGNSLLLALIGGGWGSSTVSATVTDSGGHLWTTVATATGATSGEYGVAKIAYTYLATAPGSIFVSGTFTNLSGGAFLAVRVLNNAAAWQAGAGANTLVNASTTAATITDTTTKVNSQVYGIGDAATSNVPFTPNGATTSVSTFADATDTVTLAAWKGSAPTITPGATTFGGTWGATSVTNIAVFEVLSAVLVVPLSMAIVSQSLMRASCY